VYSEYSSANDNRTPRGIIPVKLLNLLIPRHYRVAAKAAWLLERQFGHLLSAKHKACIDANGNPIPWYTYPAIEYLKQLNFKDCDIFEYGCGNSSLFWGRLGGTITSIEHNPDWHKEISSKATPNMRLLLRTEETQYIQSIHEANRSYDVIIVDGVHRLECARECINRLSDRGLIILDNSDWFINTAELLRKANFIQVDMSGFGPINPYTWTTSLFFSRQFNIEPATERQPCYGIGALKQLRD